MHACTTSKNICSAYTQSPHSALLLEHQYAHFAKMILATTNRTLQKLLETKSISKLQDALFEYRERDGETYPDFVRLVFNRALSRNILEFVEHLISHEIVHLNLSGLSPLNLWDTASKPILELLLRNGWNINQQLPQDLSSRGRRLVHSPHVLQDYQLVVWMVEHGAIIDDGDLEAKTPCPPTLLEDCGPHGAVRSFKYLQSKGARCGKKTLHLTARVAADLGADPSIEPGTTSTITADQQRKDELSCMLRYLVDEAGLFLDAIEVDGYCAGPPISFAASQRSGAGVVRWLLAKGANPTLGVEEGSHHLDAEYWAVSSGNEEGARLINAWKEDRDMS